MTATAICNAAADGKAKIDEATDKARVELAVKIAKEEIDEVEKMITGLGGFEGLDPEIELQIIKTYFGDEYKGQESVDKNIIGFYYGTYDGSVVVYCHGWAWGGWQFGGFTNEVIEGYLFIYPHTGIRVWRDGVFYSLQDAYDKGFLTKENLERIETLMREYHYGFYIDPPIQPAP